MRIHASFTTDRATDEASARDFVAGIARDAQAYGVADLQVDRVSAPVTFDSQEALDAYVAERITGTVASVVTDR
jgi:hypothetical protein